MRDPCPTCPSAVRRGDRQRQAAGGSRSPATVSGRQQSAAPRFEGATVSGRQQAEPPAAAGSSRQQVAFSNRVTPAAAGIRSPVRTVSRRQQQQAAGRLFEPCHASSSRQQVACSNRVTVRWLVEQHRAGAADERAAVGELACRVKPRVQAVRRQLLGAARAACKSQAAASSSRQRR